MEKIQKRLKKEFGESKISMASETPKLEVISTGSVGLDFATGVGGIPRGCIAEIFGAESMGKTTLAYYMIAGEQRKGGACAFINLEGEFHPKWAEKVAGVDTSKLILARPAYGEEAADMLLMMINEEENGKHLSLIVFDSVGAMLAMKEVEVDGKDRVGGQSKLITGMVKRVLPAAAANGVTVVFLNQIRDVMNATYGGVVESPGGHALKHAAVIRVQLKPGGQKYLGIVNGQKKEIGHRVTAVVKKNKAGSPKATASWDFIHDEVEGRTLGIDRKQEIIDLSIQYGIITQNGASYGHALFPEDDKQIRKIYARDNLVDFLTQNPIVLDTLREELMQLAQKTGGSDD